MEKKTIHYIYRPTIYWSDEDITHAEQSLREIAEEQHPIENYGGDYLLWEKDIEKTVNQLWDEEDNRRWSDEFDNLKSASEKPQNSIIAVIDYKTSDRVSVRRVGNLEDMMYTQKGDYDSVLSYNSETGEITRRGSGNGYSYTETMRELKDDIDISEINYFSDVKTKTKSVGHYVAKIYGWDVKNYKKQNIVKPQEILENFYPDYHRCNEIAEVDRLLRFLGSELTKSEIIEFGFSGKTHVDIYAELLELESNLLSIAVKNLVEKACEEQREICQSEFDKMFVKIVDKRETFDLQDALMLKDKFFLRCEQPEFEELFDRGETRLLVFPAGEVKVGNKILNPEQIKQLVLEKKVRVSDVAHEGKLYDAIVKIEDGEIKKGLVSTTLKQPQNTFAIASEKNKKRQQKTKSRRGMGV